MSNDKVNHPNHYNAGDIECIEALKAATVGLGGIESLIIVVLLRNEIFNIPNCFI